MVTLEMVGDTVDRWPLMVDVVVQQQRHTQ
jgi:hypothetical protein